MARYQGSGGAIFEIDNPDPAQVESGALRLVEDPEPTPAKKAPAKKAAASKPDDAEDA